MKDEYTYDSVMPPTLDYDSFSMRPNMTYDTGPQLPAADQPLIVADAESSENTSARDAK